MKTKLLAALAAIGIAAGPASAGQHGKVEMCHRGSTIIVSVRAAVAHLGHGDEIGACVPETPPEPPDTDGDGVVDAADACPGTSGAADAAGCDCSQRGDCDSDGDGVPDRDDSCPGTPTGDETYPDGCTVITLSAFAGPDMDALPGDVVDAVGQGSVLTGDYDPADLVYLWEQIGGEPVQFNFSSMSLTVDTTDAIGDVTFLLTVSTADGSAEATDEFTISVDLDAVVLGSAVCDPDTGHCYARIDTLTWCSEMKAAANDMHYGGMRGHLATITTPEERSFLATVARNAPGIIAGTDRFEEGVWVWDDGPEEGQPIEWLPWASESEPNNLYHWSYPEGEDYISNLARGWDDLNGWRRYYVEFEPGW